MRTILLLMLCAAVHGAEFSTFIGDANEYHVARVVADPAGNTYLAGSRTLASQQSEIFLMKLDTAGKVVLFTVVSGKGSDSANDLAVDAAGNIYLAGSTNSLNFPLRGALQSAPGPGFLVKFNPDASQRIYSTYFPAAIQAMAVDNAGNAYVTGMTFSPNFPVTAGLPSGTVSMSVAGATGAFLTKVSAAGDRIVYSTLIVGHDKDCGAGSSCFTSIRVTGGVAVAVDPSGAAYLAGNTETSDLPTTRGALLASGTGAFVAKVNSAGTALVYLTYISATHYPFAPYTNPANHASAIAADAGGYAYLTGSTSDSKFPATRGAWQTTFAGAFDPTTPYVLPPTDAFVLKLKPDGSGLVWASYLGGQGVDTANAIAVDASGAVWVGGVTASAEFPNAQGWSQGGDFVAGFSATGASLPYAARFPDDSAGHSLAVDSAGLLHAAGTTGLVSTIAPSQVSTPRIFAIANAAAGPGGGRIVAQEMISIHGPHIGAGGDVRVSVGGISAPTLFVSDSWITAVVPANVAFRNSAAVHISSSGPSIPDFPVTVTGADPEVFRQPDGYAAALNEDGTVNSSLHPAKNGSVVTLWITGADLSEYGLSDSQVAVAARNLDCCRVHVFGTEAAVLYAGPSPGLLPAVIQINIRLPFLEFFAAQPWLELTVESAGRTSQPVRIYSIQ